MPGVTFVRGLGHLGKDLTWLKPVWARPNAQSGHNGLTRDRPFNDARTRLVAQRRSSALQDYLPNLVVIAKGEFCVTATARLPGCGDATGGVNGS